MHNILAAELMKLKKNKMAETGTLLLCAMPVLAMIKKILIDKDSIGLQEWYLTIFLLQTIALPVVNGFVLTSLIQREYQDCTLRNTLCAPVSRSAFLLSKTVIWFLWFFLSASAAMLLTLSGARLLFPSGFGTDELLLIAGQLTQQALLVFLTSLPALWIAVSQRAAFYPALLAVLGFAILETAGMQVSVEWLLPASLCPWTAVSVSALVEKGSVFYFLCLLSAALWLPKPGGGASIWKTGFVTASCFSEFLPPFAPANPGQFSELLPIRRAALIAAGTGYDIQYPGGAGLQLTQRKRFLPCLFRMLHRLYNIVHILLAARHLQVIPCFYAQRRGRNGILMHSRAKHKGRIL